MTHYRTTEIDGQNIFYRGAGDNNLLLYEPGIVPRMAMMAFNDLSAPDPAVPAAHRGAAFFLFGSPLSRIVTG
ncbi:hypothetical protein [Paenibacillus lutimineralis]|uniref:Uncharacterized protein n=1 Tax=Paenibacillus lutimineralis TaxID=2707005 RepID=A0A3S9UYQ5_9BACL|nr:hypothetical protein [Paenibacillus lutimineralis]AZS15454.1 hypothetical protein EI981_13975 [Paenibacillus lutimineralis]